MGTPMEIAMQEMGELIAAAASPQSAIDALQAETVTGWANVVTGFGADPTETKDSTAAFQKAVDTVKAAGGGTLFVPDGTYLVKATGSDTRGDEDGGVIIDSSLSIILSDKAVLKAIPGSKDGYAVLNIKSASKVVVQGGRIVGDRDDHTGVSGEWGFGIRITDSSDIVIRDVAVTDCWGDGIILRSSDMSSFCANVLIDGVVCDNNRRQGITIASAKQVLILNSKFTRTNGTNPQSGIDIEKDSGYVTPENITISQCEFSGNTNYDVVSGSDCTGLTVKNCKMIGAGLSAVAINSGMTVTGLVVTDNIISEVPIGVTIGGAADNAIIARNAIDSIGHSSAGGGVYVDSAVIGVKITNNYIHDCYDAIFIGAHAVSKFNIAGNTVVNVNRCLFIFNTTLNGSYIGDNVIDTTSNVGLYLRMQYCHVVGNKFSNVARDGMIGAPVGCVIALNQLYEMGSSDQVNYRSIIFDAATASDNYVFGNYIRNSNTSHIALRMSLTPSVLPNVFAHNDARYSATSVSVVTPNILESNYTANSLQNTFTWDPASMSTGSGETSSAVTVTGAAFGDFVQVAAPYDLQGIVCSGYVSAANTVRVRLQNGTGSTIDLASGTWKVRVIKS